MKNLLFILSLFCALSANALDRITATISFTNTPANANTITVNGNVRTWKTVVATPATEIAVTNSPANSATNYFEQITQALYGGPLTVSYVNSTNIQLVANSGNALVVSASGTYATITMSTQTVTSLTPVRVPLDGEPDVTVRENIASDLVQGINDYSVESFDANTFALANHLNLTEIQTVIGVKTFSGANTYSNTAQYFSGGSGTNITFTNCIAGFSNGVAVDLITTNLVNYGDAIRSKGSGLGSDQFGDGAQAAGDASLAVGAAAIASDDGATAVGNNAVSSGVNSVSLGAQVIASGGSSTALGTGATATHTSSTALGSDAITTADNQVRLGTDSRFVSIPGGLQVEGSITNSHWVGTNTLDGDVSFIRKNNTSLANGANAALDISTNLYVKVSGPSGSFTINGIAGGRDGRMVIIQNSTGFTMTVANDSGVDPTAANRIITGPGSDITAVVVTIIYDSATSRWVVVSKN